MIGRSPSLVLSLLLAMAGLAAGARAATVELVASRDNTLYEDDDGALSNGAGSYLFAGTTSQTDPDLATRRALLRFDLGGAVPPGSTVTAATLTLYVSRAPSSAPAAAIRPSCSPASSARRGGSTARTRPSSSSGSRRSRGASGSRSR